MTNPTPFPRHGRLRRGLLGVLALAVGAALLLPAAPAQAHDELSSSDPAAGATVDALPAQLVLTFSGDLIAEEGAAQVTVLGSNGADLTAGDPVVDGRIVTQPLGGTATGTVVVTWRVVSGDGHPISDSFVFGVGEAPVAPSPDDGTVEPISASPGVPGWLIALLSLLGVGLLGASVFLLLRKARGGDAPGA